MEKSSKPSKIPTLYNVKPLKLKPFNLIFSSIYSCGLIALFFRHTTSLLRSINSPPSTSPFTTLVRSINSPPSTSIFATLLLIFSDLILAYMWLTAFALRSNPISREEFPENLDSFVRTKDDFPGLDVFVCTADPYKEPPMSVVNTVLSSLAYEYPAEKLSVYVSDDGGSAFTLFALMEAAEFARHWLPFCRNNNMVQRSPREYFESSYPASPESETMKMMYEGMKGRVELALERGKIENEYVTSDQVRETLEKWSDHNFTKQSHPTVIQVLLENEKQKDIDGTSMPNLVYVSREKSRNHHHYFKAGALNTLIRVSAVMTNGQIILTQDCDMFSNDPQAARRVLCYYLDPNVRSQCAFFQYPQLFHGINKNDIYGAEFKRVFVVQAMGFDGLRGTNHVGTGCFFNRRAFFGNPTTIVSPQIPELSPHHVVNHSINSPHVLELAHRVAACNFEDETSWGYKMGYRYGSLVEDFFTGYRLHCEGWKSIFLNPKRPAFLGSGPGTLLDLLSQQKRWAIGVLEVGFSKYSPWIYGPKRIGILTSLAYSEYAFWAIFCIPITVYSFLPQLALLNDVSIFPQVTESWFLLYLFLFIGSYAQELVEFVAVGGGTFLKWWNDQRIWIIRGVSCHLFGATEFILSSFGISTQGFNVTSKVVDDDQGKRYEQGIFEFGAHSPMFVSIVTAALINLLSFTLGLIKLLRGINVEGFVLQILISGFGVANSWPVYEAIFLRNDKGKIPAKTTAVAAFLTGVLCIAASSIFN